MERWYALHTKPNAEYQLAAALQQRGLQTYLPEIRVKKNGRGRSTRPFFPCYIFSKIDLDVVGFSQVRWTPGLRSIVAFGERPTPLPEAAIALIQQKLEQAEAAPAHSFKPGDPVKIVEGPFQDMTAIFDGPTTASERVQVLLDILGRASRVQVGVAQLERATPEKAEKRGKRPRRTRGRGRRINHKE